MPSTGVKKLIDKVSNARDRHRERHRPTGYGFVLSDSIDYLDPAQWAEATSGASLFLTRAYLRTIERSGPEGLSQRYAVVFRGERPVAAVAAQVLEVSAGRLVKDPAPPLEKIRARVIVCGNLLSWGFHGVAFAPGEDAASLWPAVAEALYRIRRAERLSGQPDLVMVKDICEAQGESVRALERFSYRSLETDPNMVLDIRPEWQSYDDYLAGLASSYRKAARKILKGVEEAGCRLERVSDVGAHSARLHELYGQVHGNAAVRPVTLPSPFLPALGEALGDLFRCTLVRRGDEVLGFVTAIKDGEEAVGYFIGFDRAENARAPVYLRLLHSLVEDAIEWRCTRLSLGRTALEPKARLGCRPEPMKIWMRHRLPPVNLLVGSLLRVVPHEEAPERNAFAAERGGETSRKVTEGAKSR